MENRPENLSRKFHRLFIPKGMNARVLKACCTYLYPSGETVCDIEDLGAEWSLPREVFSDDFLQKRGYEVARKDLSRKTAFSGAKKILGPETAKTKRAQIAQQEALQALDGKKSGVIRLAPGTGKTALALSYAQKLGQKTLVVVHTIDLQQQWADRARELLGLPEENIGFIGGISKKWNWQDKDLVIGLVQALLRRKDDMQQLYGHFGLAIYDEVHHMQGKKFREALEISDGVRIGLTATSEVQGREVVFHHHIGPLLYANDETDLIPDIVEIPYEAGISQQEKSYIRKMQEISEEAYYASMLNAAGRSNVNNLILNRILAARKEGRTQLVLSDRIEQLRKIHGSIPGSSLLIGETKRGEDRKSALHDYDVVCAIYQLCGEGLDRESFDVLHICLPWAGMIKFVQGIGRILRAGKNKNPPVVYAYNPTDIPILNKIFAKFRSNCRSKKYKIRREGP